MLRKAALAISLVFTSATPVVAAPAGKPVIVLVHGAFADALGWQKLIPILQRDGFEVTAVENPLESLDGDVTTTKRVIDAQTRPVVLVGHSYGGAVITGAAAGSTKVKALVYLAAFAPDSGEPVGAFGDKYPVPLATALRPDSAGFLYIDRNRLHEDFAEGVSDEDAAIMAATQKPLNSSVFKASVPLAAWKAIPSWFVVSKRDRAINPDLERFYAKRMGAHTSEIDASHIAFITHPKEIAAVIEAAANAVSK